MHTHSVCMCVFPLSADSQRATELNPYNATCRYLLGRWYKHINNNTIPNCMLSVYLILYYNYVFCPVCVMYTVLCRCFSASEIPWYLRQVVSAIFATPPSSTYQEALKHFQKAEECGLEFLLLGFT